MEWENKFVEETSIRLGETSHFSMLLVYLFIFFATSVMIALWPAAKPSPPPRLPIATSHTDNKSAICALAWLWAVTPDAATIDPSPAADRRQNDSDSSHWCISASWLMGYLCANYSRHTSRARESSFYLNRKAWLSCSKSTANNCFPRCCSCLRTPAC